jgi:hypothetical protein
MTEKPIIETSGIKKFSITVEYVFKANFNDTYWLEKQDYDFEKLSKETLTWIDPYNGRSKIGNTAIALSYCSDDSFVILINENGMIREERHSVIFGCILCEDYDDSMLLSARIDLH